VHLGHQKIFEKVKESSKKYNCKSLVITFDPHPSTVLYPARSFSRLTRDEKKLRLIEEYGLDGVLTIPFTLSFAEKGPLSFVEEVLHPLRVRELYVGHDFSFGSGRSGNVKTLVKEGEILGFKVYEIPEVTIGGNNIRSSNIRKLIAQGDVATAGKLLGRFYSVSGTIIKGGGRGVKLGFPTANLGDVSETPPGPGVYATKTTIDGKEYGAATHVGVIPTFDVDVPGIETHLFDFDRDITGSEVEVLFIEKIRDTVKFESVDELIAQIDKDCKDIRSYLSGAKRG
jgi:riboflavin kinase/FMN adenylyltransferase